MNTDTPDHSLWDNPLLVKLLFLAPTIFPLWVLVQGGSPIVGAGLTVILALGFAMFGISTGTTFLVSIITFVGLCVELFFQVTLGISVGAGILVILEAVVGLALFVGHVTWYVLGEPFVAHWATVAIAATRSRQKTVTTTAGSGSVAR